MLRNITAGAEGASQNPGQGTPPTVPATDPQNSTASIPSEIELDLGGEKIKATPDQIKDWKLAHERKTTNADKLLTKKSQELSEKMKVLDSIPGLQNSVAELTRALQIQKDQSPANAQGGYEPFDDSQGNVDPDKVAEFLVEKALEKLNPRIDKFDKYLSDNEMKTKQDGINKTTGEILEASQLEDADKKMFVDAFLGRHFHELDDLPMEDGFDNETMQNVKGYKSLLKEEIGAYEKMMKERGLLKNKQYADKVNAKNKNLSTDHGGSSGMGTGKDPGKKPVSEMQESRNRVARFTEILNNMNKA